jgi:YD repeat-containing protein
MRKYILFILLLGVLSMKSQKYIPQTPQIIPPSPQAQLYMRYGEIPVSHSTGIPDIGIPIYEININGFSLPINISYHAGGNKVDDTSGTIGLGWVLNAGGIITQTVSRFSDEWTEVKFLSASEAYEKLNQSKIFSEDNSLDFTWYNMLTDPLPLHIKTISDRFSFSFNGNTGIFRKDIQTGDYKIINHLPVRIERPNIEQFKITDIDGNIWYFKRFKSRSTTYEAPSYEFHVEKIEIINTGDIIRFTYSSGDKILTDFNSVYNIISYNKNPEREIGLVIEETVSKADVNAYWPVLLNKIEWKNSKIDFLYKKDRLDYDIKERLDKILVTTGSTLVSSIEFQNKDKYLGTDRINYRMILDGIILNAEKYKFFYNQTPLPPKYGHPGGLCDVDFWGYYNGAGSQDWCPFDFRQINASDVERRYRSIRESNPVFTQAGILEEIVYPAGGRTVFEYEQNKGKKVYFGMKSNQPEIDYFGGLRIRRVKNFDKEKLLTTKVYEYEGGPAITLSYDHYYKEKQFFHMENEYLSYPYIGTYKHISSSEFYPVNNPWGPSVFYNKVVEYSEGENNGKTEYEYESLDVNSYTTYFSYRDYGQTKHLLKSKKVYGYLNGNYYLLEETVNKYENAYQPDFITGVVFDDNNKIFLCDIVNNMYIGFVYPTVYDFYYSSFSFGDVRATRLFTLLKQSVAKQYTPQGVISTITDYAYDSQYRILSPIEIKVCNSDGKTFIERNTYPFNYSSPSIYPIMVNKNMISPVIQKSKYELSNLSIPIHTIRNDYKQDNNKIHLDYVSTSNSNNPLEKRIQYLNYDYYGNPNYILKDGTSVVYLWSYSGQYPIAEIRNATFSEAEAAAKSVLSVTDTEALSVMSIPNEAKLKDGSLQKALPNALVTTYTYKPLVGILTATDPSGITTYYDYDTFGRLKEIYIYKDNIVSPANKQTVQKYEYNYKN